MIESPRIFFTQNMFSVLAQEILQVVFIILLIPSKTKIFYSIIALFCFGNVFVDGNFQRNIECMQRSTSVPVWIISISFRNDQSADQDEVFFQENDCNKVKNN